MESNMKVTLNRRHCPENPYIHVIQIYTIINSKFRYKNLHFGPILFIKHSLKMNYLTFLPRIYMGGRVQKIAPSNSNFRHIPFICENIIFHALFALSRNMSNCKILIYVTTF